MARPSIPIKHYLIAAQLFKWASKDHYIMWFEGHTGRHRRTETVLPRLVKQGKLRAIEYKKMLVYAAPRIRLNENVDLKIEHGLGCTEGLIRIWWSRMDGVIIPERYFYGCGCIPEWGIHYPNGKILLFEFSTRNDFEHSPRFRSKISVYQTQLEKIEVKFGGEGIVLFVVDIERERLIRFIKKLDVPYFFTDFQTFKKVPIYQQLLAPIYIWGGDGKEYPLKEND
jgi:hypothetical protein